MIVVNIIVQVMIIVITVDMVVNWIVKVMKGGMGFMTEKRFRLSLTNYDDEVDEKGNPVFVEEEDFVGIFTEDYVEHILMNGV